MSTRKAYKQQLVLENSRGVAALLTIIIVAAATLIMAYSASLLGLGELDLGYTSSKGGEALALAEGCAEEAMRRIRIDTSYTVTSSSLVFDNGSCIITVESSGSNRTIKANSTVGDYHKKIKLGLSLSGDSGDVITIGSWEELSD